MGKSKSKFQRVMEAVAILSAAVTAVLSLLCLFQGSGILLSCAITAGVTCYHFSMRLAVGLLVSSNENRIKPDCRWFSPKKWEAPLYRFLGVKKWKDRVPTYSPASFDLSRHTPGQLIHTMCVSEAVHECIILMSFLPLLLIVPFGTPGVFFLTSLAAAAVDCIFVILQRYNRPRMVRLAARQAGRRIMWEE